jgi:ribonuclease R
LNEAEIKNQKTERKALKLCASYLLQNQIGQTFKGEIQGIEEFGVFISVSSDTVALADGLVHLRDIPGDFYLYNEARGILVGKRTGKIFKRGDKITVKLINVNPVKGENDFEIAASPWQKREKKNRRFGRQ